MLKYCSSLIFILFLSGSFLSAYSQTVGLFENDEDAFNGYTFFSASAFTDTYLIDNCGRLVHSWSGTSMPGAVSYLLENGDVLRAVRIGGTPFTGGGIGGRVERVSWDGQLEWSFDYASDDFHHHHDVAYLPNGNVLILAWEAKSVIEAITAGRDPDKIGNALWPDHIVEIQPEGMDGGTIVWEWHFWDHMIQDFDSSKENFGVVADHPELLDVNYQGFASTANSPDWIHCNAINYNEERDEILLSSRHLSEIYVIDHSTTTEEAAGHTGGNSGKGGDILYRWGNPQSYQRGDLADRKGFGQHDAHWIESGLLDAGKIMFYNNGIGRPAGPFSTVDIIEPPLDNNGNYMIDAGEPFGPSELSWSYAADPPNSMFSSNISGAQRLPNGNTLICEGARGTFWEVGGDGEVHWNYKNPVGLSGPVSQGESPLFNAVFRAYRYGPTYPAFDGKDLSPGEMLELNPTPSDCTLTVSVDEKEVTPAETFEVYPNPFEDYVIVKSNLSMKGMLILTDALGRKIYESYIKSNETQLDLKGLNAGIYLLQLPDQSTVKLICYP